MHSPRSLGWIALGVSLLQAPAWAGAPSLSPDEAVARALTAHPDRHAADAAVSVARADRRRSAVLLSNPTVFAWSSTDGARAALNVAQPLSLTGEGWHARGAARASLDAAERSLARRRREIAAQTRLAYVDAAVATGLVGVAEEGAELAGRLRFAVQRKLEEGEASALDLRLARLSEAQAAARLLEARRAQAEALRTLSTWVAVPVEAEALTPDPEAVAPEGATHDTPRSDVLAAEAAVEQAKAERRRAWAAAIPPVAIGARVALEDGQTFLGPSVNLAAPVFDRNQRERAASEGRLAVAEGRLRQLHARAQTEQATARRRVSEAGAAAERVQADADDARDALASIEAGVLAGQIDLSTAVLLQTQVLDGEGALVRLRGLVADARIDQLLANDDDALLGGAP